MPIHFKTGVHLALSLFLMGSSSSPLLAQQAKKTTTPQKKTTSVVKKTTTVKSKTTATTKAKATKTKTTVVKKAVPVKPITTKAVPIPELKMSLREDQMVDEINLVRSDPSGYIKYIKEFLARTNPGKHTVNAANELIDELKRLKSLNALKIDMNMYRDARDYGLVMMQNNTVEHSDLPYNENLSFGIEDVREVIIDLLIDEDIPDHGHRKNILNKGISMVAVHELPGTVDDFHYCYIQEFR